MFLEWLIPWQWARITVRIVFIFVVLGIWLIWFAGFFLKFWG